MLLLSLNSCKKLTNEEIDTLKNIGIENYIELEKSIDQLEKDLWID